MNWTFDEQNSNASGWYAITKCWDASEGLFPDAAHWNGTAWDWSSATIVAWAGPFESETDARKWAEDNDVEAVPEGCDS